MDDRGAEILLGGVGGGREVRAVEEDEQAGAVLAIARLEAQGVGGVRLRREEGAKDEAVDGVLDPASAEGERGRGERVAEGVQVDGAAEPVAQLDRPERPS